MPWEEVMQIRDWFLLRDGITATIECLGISRARAERACVSAPKSKLSRESIPYFFFSIHSRSLTR